jgi:hypothetical protein
MTETGDTNCLFNPLPLPFSTKSQNFTLIPSLTLATISYAQSHVVACQTHHGRRSSQPRSRSLLVES